MIKLIRDLSLVLIFICITTMIGMILWVVYNPPKFPFDKIEIIQKSKGFRK
jgi:hypothetical protein